MNHVDLRDVTLGNGRNAFDYYQELAGHPKDMPSLKDTLTGLVQTPEYNALPHGRSDEKGTRQWEIMGVVKKYREAAEKQMKADDQGLRDKLGARQQEIFKATSAGVQSLQAAGARPVVDNINKLLGNYNLGQLPTGMRH